MAYINGAASISPQEWTEYTNFIQTECVYEQDFLTVTKPDYKQFIKPMQVRRMSKTVKNSIVASSLAMKQANASMPQAIITASGLGVVSDTQDFLQKMIDNNEAFLTPTSFIQSTHNTPAAHIAVRLNCHAYNYTYVNRGHSFENALQDALMHIAEGKNDILVGGSDEMTEQYYTITKKMGWWRSGGSNDFDNLFYDKQNGALCGEGTNFFVLSNKKNSSTQSKIQDIDCFYKPDSDAFTEKQIRRFLKKNNLGLSDIDLVILGNSGDHKTDRIYNKLNSALFADNATGVYKQLCGEYHTASAFALWLANVMIKRNEFAEFIQYSENTPRKLENILIYNHYFDINHSLILVSKA